VTIELAASGGTGAIHLGHPEEPEPFIWDLLVLLSTSIDVDRMEDVLTFLAVTSVDC
jgi:hypothetical protein